MKPVIESGSIDAATVVSIAAGRHRPTAEEPTPRRRRRSAERASVVAYVDPSPLTRECISRWLTTGLRDMRVRAIADPIELEGLAQAEPAVRLLVVNTGVAKPCQVLIEDALAEARRHWPDIIGIILSARAETEEIDQAFRLGMRGYITPDTTPEVVLEAIRLVLVGGAYRPLVLPGATQEAAGGPSIPTVAALAGFTPRETQILQGIRLGEMNKRIAAGLNMSESTVKVHVSSIMKKLGARTRTQVAYLTRDLPGSRSA